MSRELERGAQWRIWDMQVHTPFSELNNGFGNDFDKYAKEFFERAVQRNVAVVGVTDYFCVDGYRALRELQKDFSKLEALVGTQTARASQLITLLANVELRTDVLVDGNRVNYHVIFSDDLSADEIELDFIAQLQFTAEGNPNGADHRESLTKRNLERLGQKLKHQHLPFRRYSDLFAGMMQATVSHKEVSDLLTQKSKTFGGRYIFGIPCDEDLSKLTWNGQGHLTRKVLIQKSHALFSSNSRTRDFALGLTHPTPEDYLAEFLKFKPCLHGSDAHSIEELFQPKEDRFTWVKADPTFNGLLQTLNEPQGRVFIGLEPPAFASLRARPTKVIRSVDLRRKPSSTFQEEWFAQELPLNPELVAIIGNKGSGKSALADIIGLLGNTPRHDRFSFLNDRRFRDRKLNKARHFEARLTWADGTEEPFVSLDSTPDDTSVESVKYIPQDYLESICNEVGAGAGTQFYRELQNVIFSHVAAEDRLGQQSLDDLLNYRSAENSKAVSLLTDRLKVINDEIELLEDRCDPQHEKTLKSQLASKRRELAAAEAEKPTPPEKKDDQVVDEVTASLMQALSELKERREALQTELAELRRELSAETKRHAVAAKLLGKIQNVVEQIQIAGIDAQPELDHLGVTWNSVMSFKIDTTNIENIATSSKNRATTLTALLRDDNAEGPLHQLSAIDEQVAGLQTQLTAPQQAAQRFEAEVKAWNDRAMEIVGDESTPGTIRHLSHLVSEMPTIRRILREKESDRREICRSIFRLKKQLCDQYSGYYQPVQDFIQSHPIAASQQFRLSFNVAVHEHGFAEHLLGMLNQRKVGSFAGLEEGRDRLDKLLGAVNFDHEEDTLKFIDELFLALRTDQREGKSGASVEIKAQLMQEVTRAQLYNFVFGLSYLRPIYNLRWDGKALEQLSPGERGNILLIFYLLIDRDNIPLVIDQPEENLDNHTVFRTLVPCVKEAKLRRQIILVTHNRL